MSKNKANTPAKTSTSISASPAEPLPSKEAALAFLRENPSVPEVKTRWDGVIATARRIPDNGIISEGETMRFNPPAAPGQKRVGCYI